MDAIFWSASIVVGFVSGAIALFAPCCLTVLLPTYLAQIVQTRVRVLLSTLVFSLGIAAVMLPIALGFRELISIFNDYHPYFYGFGGVVMTLLGLLLIFQFKLPMFIRPTQLHGRATFGSLFLLGVTSGLATACCAPVLVGAIALTALSPSTFLALLVGLSYVAGMVMPLLLGALLMSGSGLMKIRTFLNRPLGPTTTGSLLAGLVMIGYGLFLGISVLSGRLINSGEIDPVAIRAMTIGRNISKFLNENPIYAVLALIVFVAIVVLVVKRLKKELEFNKGGKDE
ncbi:MAG: cytochrome c biogenesis CcdA family protein [Candidatus Berkelbacteria bacterium]|nr:cytochrome c biogenesis CcdA family protein [Candidatus Berkelbacteria bacterium]